MFVSMILYVLSGLALFLSSCGIDDVGSGYPGIGDETSQEEVTITIQPGSSALGTQAFGINPRVVGRNAIITWINNDSVSHTVTSDSGIWDSGTLNPGAQFSRTFTDAGTFPYSSKLTPEMRGLIQVTEDIGGGGIPPTASPTPRGTNTPGRLPFP